MSTIKEQMLEAQQLIKEKRYNEARAILAQINHPKAREWEQRMDELSYSEKAKRKTPDLIAEYKIPGYKVQLYHNRLEITKGMFRKTKTIPIRTIVKVEVPLGHMKITTVDDDYTVTLWPWQAKDLRKKLLQLL